MNNINSNNIISVQALKNSLIINYSKSSDNGTYYVKATVAETYYYSGATTATPLIFIISEASVTITVKFSDSYEGRTYNGLAQTITKEDLIVTFDGVDTDAYKIAYACKLLGAGRERKTDPIDYSVGIFLNKKSGESVKKGDILYTIYSNDPEKTKVAQKYCDEAFLINENKPSHNSLIYKIIKADEDEDV